MWFQFCYYYLYSAKNLKTKKFVQFEVELFNVVLDAVYSVQVTCYHQLKGGKVED